MDRLAATHTVPLEVLDREGEAILVSDGYGAIRYLNRPCARLLRCDPEHAIGRPCWTVARMKTPEGAPFCAPVCPIQEQAGSGLLPSRFPVTCHPPGGPPTDLEIRTVLIPPGRSRRHPLLHLIRPHPSGVSFWNETPPLDRIVPRELGLLSKRERQILQLIAAGESTRDIARRLFISPTTVYNHIQSILRKLRVHSRIEAVLLYLGSRP